MPLSYRDSIWYYNKGDTRASLAQRSKLTKLTSKVIHHSLRLQSLILFFLLSALEHLARKIFRFLKIIPIVIDKGFKITEMEKLLTLISLLVQDCSVNGK